MFQFCTVHSFGVFFGIVENQLAENQSNTFDSNSPNWGTILWMEACRPAWLVSHRKYIWLPLEDKQEQMKIWHIYKAKVTHSVFWALTFTWGAVRSLWPAFPWFRSMLPWRGTSGIRLAVDGYVAATDCLQMRHSLDEVLLEVETLQSAKQSHQKRWKCKCNQKKPQVKLHLFQSCNS